MASRSSPGGKPRRSHRNSEGEGPDLFAAQLAAAVRQGFEGAGTQADAGEAEIAESKEAREAEEERNEYRLRREPVEPGGPPLVETEAMEDDDEEEEEGGLAAAVVGESGEVIPARMLNEFVYCPRLFHYEFVQGVFVESADTVKGAAVHRRVDKGKGAMPEGKVKKVEAEAEESAEKGGGEGTEIHSRSVMLGSDRLGVVAKLDLVEITMDDDGWAVGVVPVDYKVGAPREWDDADAMWDTDRMQLGLQCLILQDNGYACDAGMIYYRATKQRVRLEITPELEAWVRGKIAEARKVAKGPLPPPLMDSPKCVRCSLAPVCLPDETHWLAATPGSQSTELPPVPQGDEAPRRLIAARDEKRALYLNTQGYRVGCNEAVLKVKEKDRVVEEVRLLDVSQVALFGNIQLSTQAVQRLCDNDIPVTWFSMGGWFYGITRGHSLKNVQVRIAQFRHAAHSGSCLRLAREFVRGKIHNHRVLFMRNHVEPPERVKLRLGQAREDAMKCESLEALLGIEGAAAAEYFAEFSGMLRERKEDGDYLEGLELPTATDLPEEQRFTFDFNGRNRRPPTDPVNALLSLAYSLLAKECTLAAYAVGFDPYVGFYHQPRQGRPALALDVMEEFRPLIAESAVITAINNRFVSTMDFVRAGKAVNLSPAGRKQFFHCFEQRMNAVVTHPIFDYKVSYRRALELQFRILARVLTGEIPAYIPFLTR